MQALIYDGPGRKNVKDRAKPVVNMPGDAIVRIPRTTVCGTDLHIHEGEVATCRSGTALGHKGVGIVDAVGSGVTTFKVGDPVLISCTTACDRCEDYGKGMYSHCSTGDRILGNQIGGTQVEHVRIRYADTSLHHIPAGADEEAVVTLSDLLPTGFEYVALNGKVQPGPTVAIVGAGPIGLATLLTAQFYAPADIIMIDLDDNRLQVAAGRIVAKQLITQRFELNQILQAHETFGNAVDTKALNMIVEA